MELSNLSRRLISWFHSISLIIFVCLTLAVLSVTPIDVVVRTSTTTQDPAIRTFIVIAAYVIFFLWSLFIYLTRIYTSRVSMNDIHTKAWYIPSKDDYPSRVWKNIEEELERCLLQVKIQAGPLCARQIIRYDGLSPPSYIQHNNAHIQQSARLATSNKRTEEISDDASGEQSLSRRLPHSPGIVQRNTKTGASFNSGTSLNGSLVVKNAQIPQGDFLPPLSRYEDILQSLGDKFMISNRGIGMRSERDDGEDAEAEISSPVLLDAHGYSHTMTKMAFANVEIPINCTFREAIMYLELLNGSVMERNGMGYSDSDSESDHSKEWHSMDRLVELYEQFRYGGELISESDMIEFMVEFDKLGQILSVEPDLSKMESFRGTRDFLDHDKR